MLVSRRRLIQNGITSSILACGCTGLVSSAFGKEPEAVSSDEWQFFVCDTPQLIRGAGTRLLSGSAGAGSAPAIGSGKAGSDPYATAQRGKIWTKDNVQETLEGAIPVVGIKFYDGTSTQQTEVIDFSRDWTGHGINVAWRFLDPGDRRKPEIVIAFNYKEKNSSDIGADARRKARAGTPTMNLHEVDPSLKPEDIRRMIVLHEFGHGIMCFGHEHRHPDAGYEFKSAAEIQKILRKQGKNYTVDTIRLNITDPPYPRNRSCGPYDVSSIMHYSVPADFLVGSGTEVRRQPRTPSEFDFRCARDLYGA